MMNSAVVPLATEYGLKVGFPVSPQIQPLTELVLQSGVLPLLSLWSAKNSQGVMVELPFSVSVEMEKVSELPALNICYAKELMSTVLPELLLKSIVSDQVPELPPLVVKVAPAIQPVAPRFKVPVAPSASAT